MEWKDGKLTGVEIRNISGSDNAVKVRYGKKTETVKISKGEKKSLTLKSFQ